ALHGEDESLRRFVAPLGETCRRLRTIEGTVDLDRRHMPGGVAKLIGVLETVRIKRPAPRRIRPSADADTDQWRSSCRSHRGLSDRPPRYRVRAGEPGDNDGRKRRVNIPAYRQPAAEIYLCRNGGRAGAAAERQATAREGPEAGRPATRFESRVYFLPATVLGGFLPPKGWRFGFLFLSAFGFFFSLVVRS